MPSRRPRKYPCLELLYKAARITAPALLLFAILHLPLWAQQTGRASIAGTASVDQILSGQNRASTVRQVAISPDGKRLAWLRSGEIDVALVDNIDSAQRITAAASDEQSCTESDFAWSPDSTSLAFFSDCASSGEQSDLYLSHLDGNPPRRLTALTGDADSPAFSPDGSRIAFLYVKGATRPAGALAAMSPPSGVIGEDGVEIQRVAFAEADASQSAAPAFASPANLYVYEFDWSPDSKSFAYIAAEPPGENNWWVANLYTEELKGEARSILAPSDVSGPLHGLQIAVPRWSPDQKSIAFIGGLMSDQGVTGGDLYLIPSTGGQPRRLTNRDASVVWFHWNQLGHDSMPNEGGTIGFTEIRNGSLYLIPSFEISTGATRETETGAERFDATITDGRFDYSQSIARDNTEAFVLSSFSQPPEIWIDRGGKLQQVSHFNDGLTPSWGKSISIEWNNDNFHVQGWLLLPAHYDPSKKYPLIVHVHGGPASAVLSLWNGGAGGFSSTGFSALDYFVLMPNPRGSFGQGETFTQANRKDFGHGDLRDILAGVDAVLAKYPVDPNRVGIAGWSYGGFMSMFAVTQTHRFHAGVAGAGISDWLSYYGENSIDQWMIPYFGASVYDDPQVYARSSAISFIKNVSTPTLTVVGDRDGECPAPQSFEFWHALHDLHVPAQLVVYPNEGHGFVDPVHQRDVMERAVDWFAKYMPPAS
jgi:dipeptidyl aminopeptidase/acylaminoacyl peptidase